MNEEKCEEEVLKIESYFETVCRYLLTEDISRKEVDDVIEKSIDSIWSIHRTGFAIWDDLGPDDTIFFIFEEGNIQNIFNKCMQTQQTYDLQQMVSKLAQLQYDTSKYYSKEDIMTIFPLTLLNMFFILFMFEVVEDKKIFMDNILSIYTNVISKMDLPEGQQESFYSEVILGMTSLMQKIIFYKICTLKKSRNYFTLLLENWTILFNSIK
nr:MAG TPA: hypothetical protein [Caudoviricetes sp.]